MTKTIQGLPRLSITTPLGTTQTFLTKESTSTSLRAMPLTSLTCSQETSTLMVSDLSTGSTQTLALKAPSGLAPNSLSTASLVFSSATSHTTQLRHTRPMSTASKSLGLSTSQLASESSFLTSYALSGSSSSSHSSRRSESTPTPHL